MTSVGFGPIVTPIEIRPGVFVRIAPLPYDLTKAEARKIANIVKSFAKGQAHDRPGQFPMIGQSILTRSKDDA